MLPYAWTPTGALLLLLAQDADGGKWSDFGGGVMRHSESELACAKRELKEESHNLIPISNLSHQPKFRFQFYDFRGRLRHYTTYLVEIPYNSNIQRAFETKRLQTRSMNLRPAEKAARLEKVCVEYMLPGRPTDAMRPFFQTRMKHLLPYIDQLKNAIERGERVPFQGLVNVFNIH